MWKRLYLWKLAQHVRDVIEIDVPERKLNVKLNEEELKMRLKSWTAKKPKVTKGYLVRYSQLVQPATKGSVLKKA